MTLNKPLTSTEFLAKMQSLVHREDSSYGMAGEFIDIVQGHEIADALMLSLLESLGYGDGVAIIRDAPKWYA